MNTAKRFTLILIFIIVLAALCGLVFLRMTAETEPEPTPPPTAEPTPSPTPTPVPVETADPYWPYITVPPYEPDSGYIETPVDPGTVYLPDQFG